MVDLKFNYEDVVNRIKLLNEEISSLETIANKLKDEQRLKERITTIIKDNSNPEIYSKYYIGENLQENDIVHGILIYDFEDTHIHDFDYPFRVIKSTKPAENCTDYRLLGLKALRNITISLLNNSTDCFDIYFRGSKYINEELHFKGKIPCKERLVSIASNSKYDREIISTGFAYETLSCMNPDWFNIDGAGEIHASDRGIRIFDLIMRRKRQYGIYLDVVHGKTVVPYVEVTLYT